MNNIIWRTRCAYWFLRRLGLGWARQAWGMAGVLLANEVEQWRRHGDPFQHPRDAVDEELACWEA